MKKIFCFVFGLIVVLYLSTATTFAQGKGGGHGKSQGHAPAVTGSAPQGRAPEASRDRGHDRDVDHDRKQTREAHKESNFEERIERNPAFKARVESMLPAGTNLKTAASGFKNQGQFIAALHVSQNLGIPFNQLKGKMTGSNPMSLGQAIHELKPDMPEKEAEKEADKAEKQAKTTRKTKRIT